MSRKIMTTFICPHCNNEVAIQIWESVNVDLNPEQKGKMISIPVKYIWWHQMVILSQHHLAEHIQEVFAMKMVLKQYI